jgi:hypothetical protein
MHPFKNQDIFQTLLDLVSVYVMFIFPLPWMLLLHVSASSKCASPPIPDPGPKAWAKIPSLPSKELKSP